MLEAIERVLASLIILGMLVILMLIAFPEFPDTASREQEAPVEEAPRKTTVAPVVPDPSTDNTAPHITTVRQESPAAARELSPPKSDLPPIKKMQGRLKQVEERQVARPRRRVVNQTYAERRDEPSLKDEPRNDAGRYLKDRYYTTRAVKKARYRDPWARNDDADCSEDGCSCTCNNRPYWATGPGCWD